MLYIWSLSSWYGLLNIFIDCEQEYVSTGKTAFSPSSVLFLVYIFSELKKKNHDLK